MRRADIPLELAYYVLRGLRLESMNSDSAVPGLSRASVAAKLVPDPPSAEDALRFARLVRPLFELQYSLEKQSSNLSQLRDALLPGLMSGRIRVREAEKAVEQAT
jgi:type I restriction enzyme S subunit